MRFVLLFASLFVAPLAFASAPAPEVEKTPDASSNVRNAMMPGAPPMAEGPMMPMMMMPQGASTGMKPEGSTPPANLKGSKNENAAARSMWHHHHGGYWGGYYPSYYGGGGWYGGYSYPASYYGGWGGYPYGYSSYYYPSSYYSPYYYSPYYRW